MAKSKQFKEQVVNDLIEKLKSAKSAVVANYDGLTVVESEDLRKQLREENIDFFIIKKTLLGLALKNNGIEDIDIKSLQGSLGIAISQDDEVLPAKIIKKFSKEHEQINFQTGVMEGESVSVEQLKKLADLPGKEELLAKMVGSLKAPISGFVNVMGGNLRSLVQVLNAIKDTKQ